METTALNILYGMPAIAGDANSAEQGLERIAFANEGNGAGWYLDETRPFMPQIAGLKGGGVWIDSQADDGRSLQNDSVGNVTETIYLILGGDLKTRYQYLSQLNRIADQARQFHTTHYQTRPVQLEWWAAGAPGPQWALIYDMSISVTRASYDLATAFEVVVTLEREPAWRGVMFGQPATVWTQYMRGVSPGAWDLADLSLLSSLSLVRGTASNKHEFDGANGYTADFPPLSKNWIDVDAVDIPGDAPALISIAGGNSGGDSVGVGPGDLYIAKSSKPTEWKTRDGEYRPQFYSLNAGDSAISAGSKVGGATEPNGVFSNGSSSSRHYWLQSAAAATHQLDWGSNLYSLSREAFRGQFAVFVRGQTDVTNPASFGLSYLSQGNFLSTAPETVLIPAYTPLPDANTNKVFYIGSFQMPLNTRSWVNIDGTGLDVDIIDPATPNDLIFRLTVITATASQTTRVIDLVLLPFDEAQVVISRTVTGSSPNLEVGNYIYDNTGYINRGLGDVAKHSEATGVSDPELLGNYLTLNPNLNNRLYFMHTGATSSTSQLSALLADINVRINIIPRWYGVRDV